MLFKTVLIVEDNLLNMKLAATLLETNGFEVLKAYDGTSALQILSEHLVDLILLDISLPDIDGYQVFEQARQLEKHHFTKIVAFTAQALKDEQQRILEFGFDGYISKPIDPERFVAEIKEIVDEGE